MCRSSSAGNAPVAGRQTRPHRPRLRGPGRAERASPTAISQVQPPGPVSTRRIFMGSRRPAQVAACGSSRVSTSVTLRRVLGQAGQWGVEGCGYRDRALPLGCAAWMTNSTWCGWTAETSSRTLHGRPVVLSPVDPARRARPGPASARRASSSRCKPGRPPRPRLRRLRACPAWSARTLARRGSARRAPLQPALRPGNGMGTPASIGRSSARAARPPRPAAPAVTSRRRAGPAHQKRAPCGPAQQPWRLLLYG